MQTPQTGFPWLPVVAIAGSLLGGGMMGTIITLLVTNYRNRRQPIGYSIETIEVFKRNPEFPTLRAFLDIGEDPHTGAEHAHALLANFSIVRVKVVNKGNQDLADFKMGITLDKETDAFDIKIETLDRHHVAEILTPVNIADNKHELDFSLRPFNRSDPYTISVYVMYTEEVGPVKLSSAHSTRFIEISSFNETRKRDIALQLIPVCLGLVGVGFAILGEKLTAAPAWSPYPFLGGIALVIGFAAIIGVTIQFLNRRL